MTKNDIYSMFTLYQNVWCLTITSAFLYSNYETKVANKCIVNVLNYGKHLVCVFVQCQIHEQNPLRAQLRGTGTDRPHGAHPCPRVCHTVSVPHHTMIISSSELRWLANSVVTDEYCYC